MNTLLKNLARVARERPQLRAAWPSIRHPLVWSAVWLSAYELLKLVELLPVKYFFDAVTRHDNRTALYAALALGGAALLGSLLRNRLSNWRNRLIHFGRAAAWADGYRKMLELSADWHVLHGTGEKEAIIPKNLNKIQDFFESLSFDAVPAYVRIVVTTAGLIWLAWPFGLLALGTMAGFGLILYMNAEPMERMRRAYHDETVVLETRGSELSQLWRTIQGFGVEPEQVGDYERRYRELAEHEIPRHREWAWRTTLFDVNIDAATGLAYLVSLLLVVYFGHGIGDAVLGTAWMARLLSNYNRLVDFEHRRQRGLEALNQLLGIYRTDPSVPLPEHPAWPAALRGRIEFRGVTFAYPNRPDQPALTDVTVTVPENTSLALVGPSGGGKSTFAALLERMYDPTEGDVTIDDSPLATLDLSRYRREIIASVSQHTELFNGTVFENLLAVCPNASPEDIYEACRKAHADGFIRELPGGYGTLVGENGIRLSGGQRQRLAIARALLRKPRILVLDEATSALDAISQAEVKRAIDGLMERKQCTIVIIAHRFSTLEMADAVAVLDGGRLVEYGSHAELAHQNGLYARLKELESAGVLDE